MDIHIDVKNVETNNIENIEKKIQKKQKNITIDEKKGEKNTISVQKMQLSLEILI